MGLGAGFYGFGLTQEQFLQVKVIQDYILVSFILQHKRKGVNAKKKKNSCFRWQRVSVNTTDLKKIPRLSGRFSHTAVTALLSVFGCGSILKRQEVHTHMQLSGKSLFLSLYYLIDSQLSTLEEYAVICFCVISSVTIVFMLYYSVTICYCYPLQVLGREVYTSNNQLGGIQIMHNNGVTHNTVCDDFEGVFSLLLWLSYMPKVGMFFFFL